MPQREFVLYQHYAAKRMLPTRRMEMHMAQLCSVLAQVNGNKDAHISDFLFQPEEEEDPDADDIKEFFGFNPRSRKQIN